MSALHDKYRPNSFEQVVGQAEIVKSIIPAIDKDRSRAFLFTGPSGCGKTTLARLAAYHAGCDVSEVVQIDAATHTGVDNIRDVQEMIRYKPMKESAGRAIILDEAHMLTKSAWNALLLVVEEPPPWILWFFCTTEPSKIPATIKTRCVSYAVKLLSEKDMGVLCARVCKAEGIKLLPEIIDLVISKAVGSARQMLVNLATCQEATSRKEAAQLLQTQIDSDPLLELCRFIVKKQGSWQALMAIVDKIEPQNAESIRIVVCAYVGKALGSAKTEKDAVFFLELLDQFATVYQGNDMSPLYLSLGHVWFGD